MNIKTNASMTYTNNVCKKFRVHWSLVEDIDLKSLLRYLKYVHHVIRITWCKMFEVSYFMDFSLRRLFLIFIVNIDYSYRMDIFVFFGFICSYTKFLNYVWTLFQTILIRSWPDSIYTYKYKLQYCFIDILLQWNKTVLRLYWRNILVMTTNKLGNVNV